MKHFLFNSKAKKVPKNYQKMRDVSTLEKGEYNNVQHVRIFGGDGTINNFINNHDVKMITLHKYGSGNDLYRSIKNNDTTFIYSANNFKFINGFGYGIDSYVCEVAEKNKKKSYFSILINALKTFKIFDLKVDIDNKFYQINNCYTISICNGKYFGGGVKIAPKAKLDSDELDVIIVHNIFGFKIIVALLLLLIKKHYLLKNNVLYVKAKSITIYNNDKIKFQIDGEVKSTNENINISKSKTIKIRKSKKLF